MSGTEDLGRLLDRLKGEVGPMPAESRAAAEPLSRQERPDPERLRAERGTRPYRPEMRNPERLPAPSIGDTAWRENKETMLFGMLAALTAALGGLLAGLEYLVLTGTVLFGLFSLVTLLAVFNHTRKSASGPDLAAMEARLDNLARKVEGISALRALREPGGRLGPAHDPELERRVDELHSLFKSLARSIGRKE
jgi:hypothetical protein